MSVFAVTTAKGVNWNHDRDIREQPFWDEHAAFADQLVAQGVIILGGPIASGRCDGLRRQVYAKCEPENRQ